MLLPIRTSSPESTGVKGLIQVLSVFFTVFAVVCPIALGFVVLMKDSDISSQYIVYTGVRTRDKGLPTVFPVSTPENDAYARVYGCMMDADIYRGEDQCGTQKSIQEYQKCMRLRPGSTLCDENIVTDSDYLILRCLQSKHNVTVRQTNVFMECLTLSQPVTYLSIQNAGSAVFLGSYNYAVLIINALTLIASFLVLTSGGWFHAGSVSLYAKKENHIYGFWSPFSIYRVYVAWGWNLIALMFAVVIAYANGDFNYANKENDKHRFPVTLWTCMLSIGSFALAVAFYMFYAFQWVFAGQFGILYAGDPPAAGCGEEVVVEGGGSQVPTESMFHPRGRPTHGSALAHRFQQMTRWRRPGGYVGVQLYDAPSDGVVTAEHIMPLMLQAFAWTWVFSDGLYFVGMLTPQSSITNESVVRVFFSITAARIFQLAGAYMASKAYITGDNNKNVEKRGVVISAVLVHVASLMCIVAATVDFMSTLKFSELASQATDSGPSTHMIHIFFLILVIILPELWRTANLLSATYKLATSPEDHKIDKDSYLTSSEALFTWEWLVRFILAFIILLPLAEAVRDQQNVLLDFLK